MDISNYISGGFLKNHALNYGLKPSTEIPTQVLALYFRHPKESLVTEHTSSALPTAHEHLNREWVSPITVLTVNENSTGEAREYTAQLESLWSSLARSSMVITWRFSSSRISCFLGKIWLAWMHSRLCWVSSSWGTKRYSELQHCHLLPAFFTTQ